MEVKHTQDEIVKALRCCSNSYNLDCYKCPLCECDHCTGELASDVLELLDAHDDAIDHRDMVIQTVKAALDKGGFSVTVNPDGTIICHPWCTEETLELPLVAKFLDNYIRRVDFNVPRMDDAFMKGGWEKVLRKAVEDGEFDDLGDE